MRKRKKRDHPAPLRNALGSKVERRIDPSARSLVALALIRHGGNAEQHAETNLVTEYVDLRGQIDEKRPRPRLTIRPALDVRSGRDTGAIRIGKVPACPVKPDDKTAPACCVLLDCEDAFRGL